MHVVHGQVIWRTKGIFQDVFIRPQIFFSGIFRATIEDPVQKETKFLMV